MSIKTNRFQLNRENGRFLGVCAGLADYLEVPAFLIRVIFVLACISWPTLSLVYFVTYWWLNKGMDEGKVRSYLSGTRTANHFRSLNYRKPLYRSTRSRRIAGVCGGIADYLEVSAGLVRILTIVSFCFFGPFTFFAYGVCWIALEKQPQDFVGYNASRKRDRHASRRKRRYGDDYDEDSVEEMVSAATANTNSKRSAESQEDDGIAMSLKECSGAFNVIENRLREAEAFITSKKFRLHCEINRI